MHHILYSPATINRRSKLSVIQISTNLNVGRIEVALTCRKTALQSIESESRLNIPKNQWGEPINF